jgi:hypothetical protein
MLEYFYSMSMLVFRLPSGKPRGWFNLAEFNGETPDTDLANEENQ